MNKKFILILIITMSFNFLYSKEKKHLSVCAIFKNENKYLKEWIEYHRLIGVDHFYLYNNNSKENPLLFLRKYVKSGLVTLIHWPDNLTKKDLEKPFMWALSTQTSAYQHAVLVKGRETEWMVFLDIDEFLTPIKSENLADFLEQYKKYPGVVVSSNCFDASGAGLLLKRNFVIEAIDMVDPPPPILQTSVEKTIFQPMLCEKYSWPPFRCVFKNNQQPIYISKQELCINHYINREKEYLIGNRKSHLDNRFLTEKETEEILKSGYGMEDQKRAIYRFLPELRKKMGN